MANTMPCNYLVDFSGIDQLVGSQAVAVQKLSSIQIGGRAEPDVRMRTHVRALTGDKFDRPHLIKK